MISDYFQNHYKRKESVLNIRYMLDRIACRHREKEAEVDITKKWPFERQSQKITTGTVLLFFALLIFFNLLNCVMI